MAVSPLTLVTSGLVALIVCLLGLVPFAHATEPYRIPFELDQTIGVVAESSGRGQLLYLEADAKGAATQTPEEGQVLHRVYGVLSGYHDQFRVLSAEPSKPLDGEPAYIFVAPKTTLKVQLLSGGWVKAEEGYARLSQKEYSVLTSGITHLRDKKALLKNKEYSKKVAELQEVYKKRPPPLMSNEAVRSLLEGAPEQKAALEVEANTIVIADGGKTGAALGAGGLKQSKSSMPAKKVSKKVDKMVVREQAPRAQDPTVHAKLAQGGTVVDKRKERPEAKGGEVGEGVSGRLLQWVYSSGGVLIFIGFVIFLNKMANKK